MEKFVKRNNIRMFAVLFIASVFALVAFQVNGQSKAKPGATKCKKGECKKSGCKKECKKGKCKKGKKCPVILGMKAELALLKKENRLIQWEVSLLRKEMKLLKRAKGLAAKAGCEGCKDCKNCKDCKKVKEVKKAAAPEKQVDLQLAGAPSWGPKDAKIVITEFSDFECPFCSRGSNIMKQLKKKYGNKIRVVFKHLPLSFHRNAHLAAQASMAAHAQGKFWAFHDKLFANYRNLSKANFIKWAKEVGLNVGKFKQALDNGTYKAQVDKDLALAGKLGVNGTPTFFVNNQKVVGAQPIHAFSRVIDGLLKK